ncbi:FAD-binding dehydrogenase [Kitasatospora sp. MMS16-BH015]|uniref:FAD-binding oxidoreductase n=1 Tax=Kitasatospora sp. MMS16-BH015 TaxID=2018025 RepID=UPI000CA12335|nr:FAD-binding oxidoreductase [Kitasatospora sp. MMS16-BH015]AUG75277.1 FAD-binding dehydrogenase [Kitasatospora sp. MMS16-BH015]
MPMPIDRRQFLATLSGVALTTAFHPWPSRHRTTAPPDWQELDRRLDGRLLLRGSPGYADHRLGYNQLDDDQYPAAVALCTSPSDVQHCLDLARGHGLPIAARSGGHSYLGYSVPDGGLVVDLRSMAQVDVRPDGTTAIGPGARLIEVYTALARAGRLLPAGACPTVGIGGLALGGGIGVLARAYGLTCDRLTAAQVVTADGTLREASPDSEPDLHWALRGGGGGNFGVVTALEFRTEPAQDLTVFSLGFPAGSAADLLGAWLSWTPGTPRAFWSSLLINGGTPPDPHLVGCHVGPQSAADQLLDSLIATAGVRPDSRSVQTKDYLGAMTYMAGCSAKTLAQCRPTAEGGTLSRDAFLAGSRLVGPTPPDAGRVTDLLLGRDGSYLLFDALGGAVADLAPDATAFPHRAAPASIQIFTETTPAGRTGARDTVAALRDGLTRLGTEGSYVNYLDATLPDWGHAYYGTNLDRLRATALRYDPDAVFAFPQSVLNA